MMKCLIVLYLGYISVSYGLLFDSESEPPWNTLRTTWGPNPLNQEYFVKQPLTVEEAQQNGFSPIAGQCEGIFVGQRFIKDEDLGVILIYDKQGTIAGIQMAIPAKMITDQWYSFSTQKMYNRDTINGIDVYVLTVYFVNPSTICSEGRNAAQLKTIGTGSGLWLQNGTNPILDSTQAPLYENAVGTTNWVKGGCFPSMGIHYWNDNRLDKDCNEFFPVFLLYNRGKLTGLGWRIIGKFEFTKQTEFPPYRTVGIFIKPVPTCLRQRYKDAGGLTSMHIFFNTEPRNLLC